MVNRRFLLEKLGLLSLAPTLLTKTVNGFDSLHPILPKGIFPPSEYLAHLADGKPFGLQITPTSPFRVAIHAFSGGLPGLGFDKLWEQSLKGKWNDGNLAFVGDGGGWTIQGNLETIRGINHKRETFEGVAVIPRNPKSLGKHPSKGAKVLFDGTNLSHFKQAKKNQEGYLGVGCETVDSFQDFLLHIEFRLPLLPEKRGQDRANSGVYIQNRYEIQILDSFALEGSKNECGSIYEYRAPEMNGCLPPNQWQAFDIDFRSARFEGGKKIKNALISVKHNDILVHDKIEIPKQTGYGRKEGPDPGPIQLQNHGSPVVFRNFWILENH
ncbi:MAG: DUF1080 domain-containing protein [Gemmataceae bacterium]|nr:DUF1080 domain-containing protein [Gemmataceae bacterium]